MVKFCFGSNLEFLHFLWCTRFYREVWRVFLSKIQCMMERFSIHPNEEVDLFFLFVQNRFWVFLRFVQVFICFQLVWINRMSMLQFDFLVVGFKSIDHFLLHLLCVLLLQFWFVFLTDPTRKLQRRFHSPSFTRSFCFDNLWKTQNLSDQQLSSTQILNLVSNQFHKYSHTWHLARIYLQS